MTNLEFLKRSCERLPRLVELHAPACILVEEYGLLTKRAIAEIKNALAREVEKRVDDWRAKRAVEAGGGNDEAD